MDRILVVQNTPREYGQDVLRGIIEYLKPRYNTDINRVGLIPRQAALERINTRTYDGVIAHIAGGSFRDGLHPTCPVVNTSNALPHTPFPRVTNDDHAAGVLAGQFLRERGFDQAIAVGNVELHYFAQRLRGLAEVFPDRVRLIPRDDTDRLADAIRDASPPVAILGMDDSVAEAIVRTAAGLDRSVPDDLVVLGFNNESLVCDLSRPTLSSVQLDFQGVGRAAAALLDRLVAGDPPPDHDITLAPLGIVERQSTDASAIADPDLRAALERIRAVRGDLTVDALLDDLPISRRGLETKFKHHLGRTPHEHILHVRVKHACELLHRTDMTVTQIAMRTGFSSPSHLGSVLKRHTGHSPTALRNQHRQT